MPVETYSKSGTKSSTPTKLDKKLFGLDVKNHDLIHRAYLAYLAQDRPNIAYAKRRGEVRGGGAKPWRQKGTGRARFGSSRNPLWVGGGVTFGPTGQENYRKKISIASKRKAIAQALSLAASEDRIKIIENFTVSDGKTKTASTILKKLNGLTGWNVLVVDQKEPSVVRAVSNLPTVKLVSASYLNVYNIINSDQLIITKPALAKLDERLNAKPAKASGSKQ